MKKIEESKNQLVFTADMDETLANAIRRYINKILVLAVDEVEISKNDSPLYDETVAHRVGLIPLESGKSLKESSKGELKLSVKKQGIVYSGDLEGEPKPIYDKIPITTLDKDQKLDFTATVKSGTGSEHSKFSPGLMFYRHVADITLDKSFLDEVKRICPNSEIKEKGGKIVVLDNKKKEIVDALEGLATKNKKDVEVKEEKDLIITLEGFGQMPVEDIFANSIDALKKDLQEASKEIGKAK